MEDVKKELPHVIVLALLILVLLVIVTKFKVVHCSEIPQWCNVYCQIMGRSRVAIISGEEGMGSPTELTKVIQSLRYYTVVEPFPAKEMSGGLLKDYDLIILEHFRTITAGQVTALKAYLNAGGSALWIGDSASKLYLSDEDLAEARLIDETWASQNKSDNGLTYTQSMQKAVNETKGFGELSGYLMAAFVEKKAASGPITLRMVAKGHLIAKGLKTEFSNPPAELAVVNERPAGVTKIAVATVGGKEYPAIFESNYIGKIVFVAFPLELANSTALITNVFDYLVTC